MNVFKKKILISASAHPILQQSFEHNGYEVLNLPTITYEQLLIEIKNIFGLVITTRLKIDKTIINAATQLNWIGRLGSGMELVDVNYAISKNINCFSTPEGNCNAVAEHVIGLLLTLCNKINTSYEEIKNNLWLRNENRGIELQGKTIGIIGFGNTGSRFAKLLESFNVNVLAYDKYKFNFSNHYIKEASLNEICNQANVISFHVPLTSETAYLANELFFNSLKQKPIIINTSRGGVIETFSLIKALQHHLISGAALDVLENENINSYSEIENQQLQTLLSFKNVLITPHIAGYTYEAFYKMAAALLKKLNIPIFN